ncbi:ribosomal protein L34 [Hamiltosporidium tvaerminnensis]|uniref:Ribosomal protein L34 n=1 Tax=Hamiltosporidium tvaerminnensis TaxID=1176355 RepID=A0A4V2JY76_9MICR|nr:hypothetical protein LUQ84_001752 [Hamiltosporidium tvaerminnensis]TBU20043.1 ribosomal protein L34 [Hamiltosporidium tvaerminnensis]
MFDRLSRRGRHSYKTRSNVLKLVRTRVSKKLKYIHCKKKGTSQKCGICKQALHGVARRRPADFSRLKKSRRTVSRTYGGVWCACCLEKRIVDTFLNNEETVAQGTA